MQDNVPCTFDGTAWTPDGGATIYSTTGATYFAGYPYDAANDGKLPAAIVSSFTPKANQSAYADYAASDLMTGAGTVSGTTLNVALAHALALVEGSAPAGATGVSLSINGTAVAPYAFNGAYRYITAPATGVNLSGSYAVGGDFCAWQQANASLEAGKYARVNVK